MSRDLIHLEPNLREQAVKMLVRLEIEGIAVSIIQTWRSLPDQAIKYRQTRNIQDIIKKADDLTSKNRPDLAEILIEVGAQNRPSWLKHGHLTMAACGESKHHKLLLPKTNKSHSYAFDIACFDSQERYITDGNAEEYQKAGEIGMELGLEWLGAEGSRFKESAHFQASGLPSTRERLNMVIE